MTTLTLYRFNALKEGKKMSVLETEGIYLGLNRYQEGYKVALFALFNFYVEVWLQEATDKIERLNAFSSYSRLDLYLDKVDISSLYSLL